MTGGIEETYELKDQDPFTFFNLIGNSLEHDAMMASRTRTATINTFFLNFIWLENNKNNKKT